MKLQTLASAILSLALVLGPITASAQTKTAQQPLQNGAVTVEVDRSKMSSAHQRAYDASLALYGVAEGESHFLCTTTVVAKRPGEYLLLTASHCVTGEDLPQGLEFYVSENIVNEPAFKDPTLQRVEVLKAENDDKYDFAILYLKSAKDYPAIPLGDPSTPPVIEEDVYVVNFSLGVAKQVALGKVATGVIPNEGSESGCSTCKGRFMVHLFGGPGASGSAVIDEKTGEIIGIVEIGFPGQTMGLGCETMKSFAEWLDAPVVSPSPKAPASAASPKS